ncbi:MAG: hypothetical protein O3A85_00090 [Proteobacteria bacterium]|nr:hypothetical protein [Pseudomonadota bacterium]
MLGFSFQKLLFTIGIIVAIWYGFKWVGRKQEIRAKEAKDSLRRSAAEPGGAGSGAASSAAIDAEDMVECAVCGAFVAAKGARHCGKDNCPFQG